MSEDFWGITWLSMRTEGGAGSSNEKGDYRELNSDWGINRMLSSLIGGSGRLYRDSNKILSPPLLPGDK